MKAIVQKIVFGAIFIVSCATAASCYLIKLKRNEKVCFFEDLKKGEALGINFQAENLNYVDDDASVFLSILDDKKNALEAELPQGVHEYEALMSNRHFYCFHNEGIDREVEVMFTLTNSEHIGDTGRLKNSNEARFDQMLRELAANLRIITSQQEMIGKHVRNHNKTAQSSNSLVVFWHIIQIILVASVCYFQTASMKRIFEKPVKSV